MNRLIQLIKVIFKPVNVLIVSALIIIGILIALYLINPHQINSDSARARIFGYDLYRIPSRSMQPNLLPGDYILVSNIAYREKPFARQDVIVFYLPESKQAKEKTVYIKRVVALSGDSVKIVEGKLIVNGLPISESYVQQANSKSPYSQNMQEVIVPNESIFVLGDNRDNSNDSRMFGSISHSNVVGEATDILYGSNSRSGTKIK